MITNTHTMTFHERKELRTSQRVPSKWKLQIATALEEQRKMGKIEDIFLECFNTYSSKMIALSQSNDTGEDSGKDSDEDTHSDKYNGLIL